MCWMFPCLPWHPQNNTRLISCWCSETSFKSSGHFRYWQFSFIPPGVVRSIDQGLSRYVSYCSNSGRKAEADLDQPSANNRDHRLHHKVSVLGLKTTYTTEAVRLVRQRLSLNGDAMVIRMPVWHEKH